MTVLDNKDIRELLTKSHTIELDELKNKPAKDSSDPLTIILGVILDYVKSDDYNYIPDSEEDGEVFYRDLIQKARTIATENKCTEKQLKIIDSIYDFVTSCEGPDALNEYLISLNPRLAFFCTPFDFVEDSIESTIELYKSGIVLKFIPTTGQINKRKEYFETHVGDKSELFMMELAETVRVNYNSY